MWFLALDWILTGNLGNLRLTQEAEHLELMVFEAKPYDRRFILYTLREDFIFSSAAINIILAYYQKSIKAQDLIYIHGRKRRENCGTSLYYFFFFP